jgi:predicted ATPase
LRRLVAEGKLNKDNLAIYYVNYNEENGESNLEQINVDEDGEVDFWPETVFNESLEEVLSIRKAQKRNRQ